MSSSVSVGLGPVMMDERLLRTNGFLHTFIREMYSVENSREENESKIILRKYQEGVADTRSGGGI